MEQHEDWITHDASVGLGVEAAATRGRELLRLDRCVAEAQELAGAGHVRRGYSALLRGYLYAECAMVGQSFAAELSRNWRAAIDAYCEEFDPQHEGEPAADEEHAGRSG